MVELALLVVGKALDLTLGVLGKRGTPPTSCALVGSEERGTPVVSDFSGRCSGTRSEDAATLENQVPRRGPRDAAPGCLTSASGRWRIVLP